ncbi:cytochrome P450 [Penicillium samsonianum]|uniref:cytochrome P450 n=1 Tax=Penicillium samsonianum TaxID=1882272 RepID=UPI002547ED52|nr:cytochrome P450 [Penicillium samsonianum]KAJ6132001.1 cytochrome P450 [Penicillium samsonianum]
MSSTLLQSAPIAMMRDSLGAFRTFTLLTVGLLLSLCVIKTVKHRRRYHGLPTPPHNMLLGNLGVVLAEILASPEGFFHLFCVENIRRKYNMPSVFYLDLWPILPSIMVVAEPAVAKHMTQVQPLQRERFSPNLFSPLLTAEFILAMEQKNWKKENPALNAALTSTRVNEATSLLFPSLHSLRSRLHSISQSGKQYPIKDLLISYIIEVGGVIQLGGSFDLLAETSALDPIIKRSLDMMGWNPVKRYICSKEIKQRTDCLNRVLVATVQNTAQTGESGMMSQSPIYLAHVEQLASGRMDHAESIAYLVNTMKVIILASVVTAGAASYCYLFLHKHPDCLREMREEHDRVFSPDRTQTWELLQKEPHRINSLHFTLAVVKETLRLIGVGGVFKKLKAEEFLETEGSVYPVVCNVAFICHLAMGRRADLFPDPDAFRPHRFLPGANPPIPADSFRPFEKGQLSCPGQNLALKSLVLLLLTTSREFDLVPVFSKGAPRAAEYLGGEGYPEFHIGPHVNKGMPVMVHTRVDA